jgi:hypothetical protein
MSENLTASEVEHLRTLLQRFTEYDLDQFDNWRFDTSYGPVFVQLARERQPGVPAEAFTSLTRPGPVATGRITHVSDAGVNSRKDVLRVIASRRCVPTSRTRAYVNGRTRTWSASSKRSRAFWPTLTATTPTVDNNHLPDPTGACSPPL